MHVTHAQMTAIAEAVHATFSPPSHIGWSQGQWGTDDAGNEIVFDADTMIATLDNLEAGSRCLCLAGAIRLESGRALGIDPGEIAGHFDFADTIFGVYTATANIEPQYENTFEPHLEAIIRWNDDPLRTIADIQQLTAKTVAHLRAADNRSEPAK